MKQLIINILRLTSSKFNRISYRLNVIAYRLEQKQAKTKREKAQAKLYFKDWVKEQL